MRRARHGDGLFERRDCFRDLSFLLERQRHEPSRVHVGRVDLQGSPALDDRFIVAARTIVEQPGEAAEDGRDGIELRGHDGFPRSPRHDGREST